MGSRAGEGEGAGRRERYRRPRGLVPRKCEMLRLECRWRGRGHTNSECREHEGGAEGSHGAALVEPDGARLPAYNRVAKRDLYDQSTAVSRMHGGNRDLLR